MRALAAVPVASVVAGWGVAQYPYLLGTHLPIAEAAAPDTTLATIVTVFGAAVVLCLPSSLLLYTLHQRGRLDGT